MTNWKLCVPTYNRKEPLILKLLDRDPNLELYFFVRQELIDEGFYDDLANRDRCHVVSIGLGTHDLGASRAFIMEWCKSTGTKYCVQFDDGIFNIHDDSAPNATISETISKCCDIMENDPMKEQAIGFSFHKRIGMYNDGRTILYDDSKLSDANYFVSFPAQAVILNVPLAFEHNITYKTLDEVGFEDCAFFADAVKNRLVYCSRKHIRIDGIVPNMPKAGGSHSASQNLERKYDLQNERCIKYIGNMMGVSIEKRYRSYANGLLSYIIWNTDFFRETLCDKPIENEAVVKAKFLRMY